MELKLYRLKFQNAHFGVGYLNTSTMTFTASRLFSALCLEAIKNDCLDEWLTLAKTDDFKLSDAFPYDAQPYLPFPINYRPKEKLSLATLHEDNDQNKTASQIHFLPLDMLPFLANHDLDVTELLIEEHQLAQQSIFMKKGVDPYEVGVTRYRTELYVLASASPLLEQLLTSLQYSGLGGKRSSGYGRFEYQVMELPGELQQGLANSKASAQLLLTTSLPTESELKTVMENAYYQIERSSGYTDNPNATERLRKEDLYKFKAGSVFSRRYKGTIVDVRPTDFPDPVLNFAKGLFFGMEV
ncbi:type III-A CRISPR-associated RAMP protein Csm4 [Ligilactobacillus saerimneri]|uniref:type III-A CRISPR-associated RAMP protein Csm4 n=1 Tax=Ligilactobacillus saerimneri TaxID=228229 RepID=UPI001C10FD07|nr:type III-A CRISPR-associated RAMP protein Csm4 [Ligilactobacillus saerimneri]MBU5309084.1 type III-A CRISPR-associated RAMP protein Csm4 [Ligilactobacillus saerimneri]